MRTTSPAAERRALGYESLPQNLAEALAAMEHSELVAQVLGEHVFVTPYELATYLPVL